MNEDEPLMKYRKGITHCQKPVIECTGEDCSGHLPTGYKAIGIKVA
jgi:hypothetical protein